MSEDQPPECTGLAPLDAKEDTVWLKKKDKQEEPTIRFIKVAPHLSEMEHISWSMDDLGVSDDRSSNENAKIPEAVNANANGAVNAKPVDMHNSNDKLIDVIDNATSIDETMDYKLIDVNHKPKRQLDHSNESILKATKDNQIDTPGYGSSGFSNTVMASSNDLNTAISVDIQKQETKPGDMAKCINIPVSTMSASNKHEVQNPNDKENRSQMETPKQRPSSAIKKNAWAAVPRQLKPQEINNDQEKTNIMVSHGEEPDSMIKKNAWAALPCDKSEEIVKDQEKPELAECQKEEADPSKAGSKAYENSARGKEQERPKSAESQSQEIKPIKPHSKSAKARPNAAFKRKPWTDIPEEFRSKDPVSGGESSDGTLGRGCTDANSDDEKVKLKPDKNSHLFKEQSSAATTQNVAASQMISQKHIQQDDSEASGDEDERTGLMDKHKLQEMTRMQNALSDPQTTNTPSKRQQVALEAKQVHEAYEEAKNSLYLHERTLLGLEYPHFTWNGGSAEIYIPSNLKVPKKIEYIRNKIEKLKAEKEALKAKKNAVHNDAYTVRKKKLSRLLSSIGMETSCVAPVITDLGPPPADGVYNIDQEAAASARNMLASYDERDKDIGVIYSDTRRDIQVYTEVIRRLKLGYSDQDLMGIQIPTEFTTVKEKTDYLNFKIQELRVDKKDIKKQRATLQKERKMVEQGKLSKISHGMKNKIFCKDVDTSKTLTRNNQ